MKKKKWTKVNEEKVTSHKKKVKERRREREINNSSLSLSLSLKTYGLFDLLINPLPLYPFFSHCNIFLFWFISLRLSVTNHLCVYFHFSILSFSLESLLKHTYLRSFLFFFFLRKKKNFNIFIFRKDHKMNHFRNVYISLSLVWCFPHGKTQPISLSPHLEEPGKEPEVETRAGCWGVQSPGEKKRRGEEGVGQTMRITDTKG